MKTKDFALEVKDLSEDGTFEGYAATFGNVDQGGDAIQPGAFIESLVKAKGERRTIPMLWQHDQREPIGVWDDIAEDVKGLYVKGRFILEGDTVAQRAYHKLKNRALGGMSIGYRVPAGGEEPDERRRGVTKVLKVDLREISLVTMPMNLEARVVSVKHERMEEFARRLRDGDPMPTKEFEDILREAGVPKSMAVQIASVGYAKAIRSESEGEKANDVTALLKALRG